MLRTRSYQDLPSYQIGIEQRLQKGIEIGIKGIYVFEQNPAKIAQMLNTEIEFVKEIINKLEKNT